MYDPCACLPERVFGDVIRGNRRSALGAVVTERFLKCVTADDRPFGTCRAALPSRLCGAKMVSNTARWQQKQQQQQNIDRVDSDDEYGAECGL